MFSPFTGSRFNSAGSIFKKASAVDTTFIEKIVGLNLRKHIEYLGSKRFGRRNFPC